MGVVVVVDGAELIMPDLGQTTYLVMSFESDARILFNRVRALFKRRRHTVQCLATDVPCPD